MTSSVSSPTPSNAASPPTFRLLSEPRERHPPWFYGHRVPRLSEARSGILYTGLELERLTPIILRFEPVTVLAAVGRKLFFARQDGPWIPYDADVVDQNSDTPVRARPWPWCLGDEVWAFGTLGAVTTVLALEDPYEASVYLAGTRIAREVVEQAVESWARETAGAYAEWVDPTLFRVPR